MKIGRIFVSTGFYRFGTNWRHLLVALHRRWRLDYVRPVAKPDYRRLYIGPLEIEWSKTPAINTIGQDYSKPASSYNSTAELIGNSTATKGISE